MNDQDGPASEALRLVTNRFPLSADLAPGRTLLDGPQRVAELGDTAALVAAAEVPG